MMPIEREIKSKVDELLTSMASGDSLALGCKTALRNRIEYKHDVVEERHGQRQPQGESNGSADSSREMEVERVTLDLAIHLLDGVWSGGPSRYPPGWEQKRKVGELAEHLEELEGQPVSSYSETKDYLASIIYRAVFFADGLELLEQWESDRRKEERDRKTIADLGKGVQWRDEVLAKLRRKLAKWRIEKREKARLRDEELDSLRCQLANYEPKKETAS